LPSYDRISFGFTIVVVSSSVVVVATIALGQPLENVARPMDGRGSAAAVRSLDGIEAVRVSFEDGWVGSGCLGRPIGMVEVERSEMRANIGSSKKNVDRP
jgi:hypothetical protein